MPCQRLRRGGLNIAIGEPLTAVFGSTTGRGHRQPRHPRPSADPFAIAPAVGAEQPNRLAAQRAAQPPVSAQTRLSSSCSAPMAGSQCPAGANHRRAVNSGRSEHPQEAPAAVAAPTPDLPWPRCCRCRSINNCGLLMIKDSFSDGMWCIVRRLRSARRSGRAVSNNSRHGNALALL